MIMETEPLSSLQATLPHVGWRRLESFLGSVERGQPENLVTPFLPDEWRSHELEYGSWYAESIARSGVDEFNAVEEREAQKFGPFSIRLPYSEREEGVLEYLTQKEVKENKFLLFAFDRIKRWIPKHSLLPVDFSDSYASMPKDSNLGLPWFTRDRSVAIDYLKRARQLEADGYTSQVYPAALGWRGQPNGTNKPKQRVVWMFDHLDTVVGITIQMPLLRALRPRLEFAAWNELSVVDRAITGMIDRTRFPILSIDFSGFDKSLPGTVIHLAFELLRYWFVERARRRIDWLENTLLTVGLVTPKGILRDRSGGMPSGAALTNAVDSLCQLLLMYGHALSGTVLGDDGVYLFDHEVDLDELSSLFFNEYGMTISSDKGSLSLDHVSYLQRVHLRTYRRHGLCVGVRSLTRTWNGATHRERGHSGLPPEFFSARTIMQLENAKWHPKFREAVKYFWSVDKYARELDPSEIFLRSGGVRVVEEVLGLTAFRFGNELPSQGLNTFETVRELRSLNSGVRKVA